MLLSKLSLLLPLFILYTAAFFSPNRRRCLKYFSHSKKNQDDGITLELTKLLTNKELKKDRDDPSVQSQSTKLALNFEKLLRTAEFANQTTTSSSSRRNDRDDDLLSTELETLLNAVSHPNNDTKGNDRVQQKNNTFTELSPFYRRDRRDYELMGNVHNMNNGDIADPNGLHTLLQARFEAKKAKDFDQIASLDRQLKNDHGVRVSDYPRLWTKRTDASKASIRQRMRKRHARMRDLFGLRGHPYLQIKSPTSYRNESLMLLSECHVHTSLSALTRCQMEGKYDQADAIKFELSLCGIRIHDRLLLWTDDANLEFEWVETVSDRVVDGPVYTEERNNLILNVTSRKGDSEELRFGGRTMEEDIRRRNQRIQQLIRQRAEADARGEATLYSLISNELKSTYQIEIDDQQQSWRISNTSSIAGEAKSLQADNAKVYTSSSFATLLFGEESQEYTSDIMYRQSKTSLPIDNQIFQQRIKELVQERIHLREEGRYLEADAIRRELWHTYNVGVSDKLCQYSVGGAYDTISTEKMLDRRKEK